MYKEDGSKGDFPADFVLYYYGPTYDWSPINQLKRALKDQLDKSNLSVRVDADALNTSPSQVMRLLQENRASKQIANYFGLLSLPAIRSSSISRRKKRRKRTGCSGLNALEK